MADASTYLAAGVDIDEADRALRSVTRDLQSTYDDRVLGGVGSFGALYSAGFPGLVEPVLVASIDGVGTKSKVATMMDSFSGLGFDIVHHCVNDILCQGARPLFFLDYFGTSKLEGLRFEQILTGMAAACRGVGASLIGGETAEMPGVYVDDEIDLVGSIVGVVEREARLPRGKSRAGDVLVALASDGLHTNGFSLARRTLFEVGSLSVRDEVEGLEGRLGDELLRPHRCYLASVGPLLSHPGVRAAAHITGGGLYDNLPRALSSDCAATVDRGAWQVPFIFRLIQRLGSVSDVEMFRAFNMGIGFVLVVERGAAPSIVEALAAAGEQAFVIGEVSEGAHDVTIL